MNKKRIDEIFCEVFLVDPNESLEDKNMLNVEAWNSVEHFAFIAEIEHEFNVVLTQKDIVEMTSYSIILRILKKYGI